MTQTYRTDDLTRWGSGKGSNLTPAEVDVNFWDVIQRLLTLEALPDAAAYIDHFEISGTQLYVHMSDSTVFGPYTLPVATFQSKGEWTSSTPYVVLDTFTINGGLYVVIFAHTSAATFDAGANDGAGHDYYALMIQTPGGAIPTGGAIGQVVQKSSTTDFATTWGWKTPAGGTARQYLIQQSNTQDDAVWETAQADDVAFTPSTGSTLTSTNVADAIEEAATSGGTASSVSTLTDVLFATGDPLKGAMFYYDGVTWTATPALSSGQGFIWDGFFFNGFTPVDALADLTDVTISSLSLNGGETLYWDGTSAAKWKARNPYNSIGVTSSTVPIGSDAVTRFTPGANLSLASAGSNKPGRQTTVIIVTSGTTSYDVSAGAGILMNGVLATGTVSGKVWTITFVYDLTSTQITEIARTGPM